MEKNIETTNERDVFDLYNELIMAVGNKYKNETRHQTALKYIKSYEKTANNVYHNTKKSYNN